MKTAGLIAQRFGQIGAVLRIGIAVQIASRLPDQYCGRINNYMWVMQTGELQDVVGVGWLIGTGEAGFELQGRPIGCEVCARPGSATPSLVVASAARRIELDAISQRAWSN